MDTLILTLQLFTSLPLKKSVEVTDERLIRGVAVWPVAGMVIGLFDILIFQLALFFLPLSISAALTLLAELWMTRGFHLDGLCDTADAFFSSRSRERMLEIMKDSHVGTFGVAAAIGDLALKYLLLTASGMPVYMLLAAPVAAKMVQGICMYRMVYPRENGLGKSYIGRVPLSITSVSVGFGAFVVAGVCAVGFQGAYGSWQTALAAAVLIPLLCFGLAAMFRRYTVKKIGGMTGDTLGAASEIIEIFCMMLIVALEGIV